jgi:Tfp pilus assembly protein PilN
MKAVNLMPRDGRASGPAGVESGAVVYILLAGLAALVVLVTLWAIAGKQVSDRTADLELKKAQIAAAEKRAGDSAAYVAFATLASNRVATVTKLSTTRFDWAHAMREVSRVLPANVWLTSMSGSSGASEAAPTPATSAAPAPTIVLVGCTRSQGDVARLLARLRAIDGVRNVSLNSSEKPDARGDASCPANRSTDPRFSIAIAFAVPGAAKSTVDATGQVTASTAAPAAAAQTASPAAGSTTARVADTGGDR